VEERDVGVLKDVRPRYSPVFGSHLCGPQSGRAITGLAGSYQCILLDDWQVNVKDI
jgi:hypothetical protein